MARVVFQKREILIRHVTNLFWQLMIMLPKFGSSFVDHSGVVRPASSSAIASAARSSRRPAATSASICLSHKSLPKQIRDVADKNFALLKDNPSHPSLHFKKVTFQIG